MHLVLLMSQTTLYANVLIAARAYILPVIGGFSDGILTGAVNCRLSSEDEPERTGTSIPSLNADKVRCRIIVY